MCTRVDPAKQDSSQNPAQLILEDQWDLCVCVCVLSPLVTASPAVTIGGVLPAPTQPQQHTHAQTHTLLSGQAVVQLCNCPLNLIHAWGRYCSQ